MSADRHRTAVNVASVGLELIAHVLPNAARDGREQALAELEGFDGDRVRALAMAVHAAAAGGDLLDDWSDRRARDRAFADAIDEVLMSDAPIIEARRRLTAIAHALRVADDGPEPWERAR